MDLGLQGKVALVVGGAGYIGSAVARRLAAEGATVVLGGRTPARLTEVADPLGAATVVVDTADDASVTDAVAAVRRDHGSVDVLVVLAAPSAGTFDPATTSEPDTVGEAIAGKALGYLRCVNAVLPGMTDVGWGRVVLVNGQNAYLTGNLAGAARNGMVLVLAKNAADSVAGTGVTVNVVNPGTVVDAPSTDVERGTPGQSSPDQIASVVAFLASGPAEAVNGECVATGHRVRGVANY